MTMRESASKGYLSPILNAQGTVHEKHEHLV